MSYAPEENQWMKPVHRIGGSQTKYAGIGFLLLFLLGQYIEFISGQSINQILGIQAYAISEDLEFWRFLSYMWFHNNLGFFLVNVSVLLLLGSHLEQIWSIYKLSGYFIFCSLIAGGCSLLFASPGNGLIGATGGIVGLCFLCYRHLPRIQLFDLMHMRQGIWIVGALVILVHYFVPDHGGDPNAAVAQLGGLLGGWIWILLTPVASKYYHQWKRYQRQKRRQERTRLRRRLEELLEKISEQGIDALTEEERSTLHRASERLDEDIPDE